MLCIELQDARIVMDAARCGYEMTAPDALTLHMQLLSAMQAQGSRLQSLQLIQQLPQRKRTPCSIEQELQWYFHDLATQIHRALVAVQQNLLQRILMAASVRATCRAAWTETANTLWQANAQIRIPAMLVVWDHTSGSRAPPIHASWENPCVCDFIPKHVITLAMDRLLHAMRAMRKQRRVHVDLLPLHKAHTLLILDGYTMYIDVHARDAPTYHRLIW